MTFRDSEAETTQVTARGVCAGREAGPGVGEGRWEGPRRGGGCWGHFLPARAIAVPGAGLRPLPTPVGVAALLRAGEGRGAGAACPPGAGPHFPVRGRGATRPASPLRQVLWLICSDKKMK